MRAWSWGGEVVAELRGRLAWWASDWTEAWPYGWHILAPSVYIFLASLLPGIAFGEQLAAATDGQLTVVHVLIR